jgi:hypothetical protein
MSHTDNLTPKEIKRGRKRERERKREKEDIMQWRVGSFTFGSVNIQSQLSNYKQTTISETQKGKNTFFRVPAITHRKIKIINIFNFRDKT